MRERNYDKEILCDFGNTKYSELLKKADSMMDIDTKKLVRDAVNDANEIYETEVGLANTLFETQVEIVNNMYDNNYSHWVMECEEDMKDSELLSDDQKNDSTDKINETDTSDKANKQVIKNKNAGLLDNSKEDIHMKQKIEDKTETKIQEKEEVQSQIKSDLEQKKVKEESKSEKKEDSKDNQKEELKEGLKEETKIEEAESKEDKKADNLDDEIDLGDEELYKWNIDKLDKIKKNDKTEIKKKDIEELSEEAKKKKEREDDILSYVKIIVIALAIAIVVNTFILSNTRIPSGSMENTIQENDRLFGFRLAYKFKNPQRGDIIIFKWPDDPSQNYIKRVIGLPGETVRITDGTVYIDDEILDESEYLKETPTGTFGPYVVPEDSYFVLGDNRNNSNDARRWNNTYVSKDAIVAKAMFRYYPKFKIVK